MLADYIGPDKILWATDYPHPDGFFPGAPKPIADRPELFGRTRGRRSEYPRGQPQGVRRPRGA